MLSRTQKFQRQNRRSEEQENSLVRILRAGWGMGGGSQLRFVFLWEQMDGAYETLFKMLLSKNTLKDSVQEASKSSISGPILWDHHTKFVSHQCIGFPALLAPE